MAADSGLLAVLAARGRLATAVAEAQREGLVALDDTQTDYAMALLGGDAGAVWAAAQVRVLGERRGLWRGAWRSGRGLVGLGDTQMDYAVALLGGDAGVVWAAAQVRVLRARGVWKEL